MTSKDFSFDKSWTLFLDRDGVINERIVDDYVKNPSEFDFLPGVLQAIKIFTSIFGNIFIVTNQQGIGKGIMSVDDLKQIHDAMKHSINVQGGRIRKIYYSPYPASDNHITRKPNTGMALQAKEDFPEVDFSKSVMIGDMEKDIEFGKKLGMVTVFIGIKEQFDNFEPDYRHDSLLSFAKIL